MKSKALIVRLVVENFDLKDTLNAAKREYDELDSKLYDYVLELDELRGYIKRLECEVRQEKPDVNPDWARWLDASRAETQEWKDKYEDLYSLVETMTSAVTPTTSTAPNRVDDHDGDVVIDIGIDPKRATTTPTGRKRHTNWKMIMTALHAEKLGTWFNVPYASPTSMKTVARYGLESKWKGGDLYVRLPLTPPVSPADGV